MADLSMVFDPSDISSVASDASSAASNALSKATDALSKASVASVAAAGVASVASDASSLASDALVKAAAASSKIAAQSAAWEAGGGGSTITRWDSDQFDGTEDSTRSDHFNDASWDTDKWTQFQDGAEITYTEEEHWIKLTNEGNATQTWRGFFKLLDTGNFTITTKISLGSGFPAAGDYVYAGIAIFDDATNNPNTTNFVIQYQWLSSGAGVGGGAQIWTDFDTHAGNIDITVKYFSAQHLYQRVTYDGTDLKGYFSTDGVGWQHSWTYNPAFDPSEFGIICANWDATVNSYAYVDWVTYHNSDIGLKPAGDIITINVS